MKVTPNGAVKVLDFGLAKALDDDRAAASISNSPTISLAATRAGVILGTAAYNPTPPLIQSFVRNKQPRLKLVQPPSANDSL